jgi:hypothetical protein
MRRSVKNMGLNLGLLAKPKTYAATHNWEAIENQAKKDFAEYRRQARENENLNRKRDNRKSSKNVRRSI